MDGKKPQPPLHRFSISNYLAIARKADNEARAAISKGGDVLRSRQAAEKSYLAAVHAARQIVSCAGIEATRSNRFSSAAIGRVFELTGKLGLSGDDRVKTIRAAMQRTLGTHTVCFYDGHCEPTEVAATAKLMLRAAKDVPKVCDLVRSRSGSGGSQGGAVRRIRRKR